MPTLQTAIQYSMEGPLHKAVGSLEEILQSHPRLKTAAAYLADGYSRLGNYEKALSILSQMWERGSWDEEMEKQRERLQRNLDDLTIVERSRFHNSPFLSHAIVPDGKGGYLVDSLGFPGTWICRIQGSRYLPPPAYLRFLKSLAWVTEQIRNNELPVGGSWGTACRVPALEWPFSGTVSITQDPGENQITLSLVKTRDKGIEWRVEVGLSVLNWEREQQRNELRNLLEKAPFSIIEETKADPSRSDHPTLCSGFPRVLMISLGLASDYAITILRDRLMHNGFPAAASFIRSLKHLESYIESYFRIPEFNSHPPHIFAVSVLDAVIEEACYLISRVRQCFPEAFVIIGGSTSQTPEQFASLVPNFDVLIRGDGDEILSQVSGIIGQSSRKEGLSDAQIEALLALPGGLIIRDGQRSIVHRLDFTHVPKKYHLPRPDKLKTIYYWQTSRGCPYDCRFCNKWSGKRYSMVLPWEEDPVELPLARRSALAMIEFLLSRLAMEWPDGISRNQLEELLKTTKASGRSLSLPISKEKMFIVIEDDDFLIHRERIKEICSLIEELGLQRYFEFSAITSVRTLYRGGDEPDRELLQWLKDSNFRSLNIGSDGLCQGTIEENQKGYTLDRHVIPLNTLLKELGFFSFNNTIITIPYTTIPQFIESVIFYLVCPYPINTAIEVGIMGHIGNKFTNEDIVNQQYDWREEKLDTRWHFSTLDNYRVPHHYPEYALNGSHIISYADPKVRDLIIEFPNEDPVDFLRERLPAEETESVVTSWANLPESRAEIKALGNAILFLRSKHPSWDFPYAIATVREEMSMLNLSSFCQYYKKLREEKIETDPQYRWIMQQRWLAGWNKEMKKWEAAEKDLRLLVEKTPWYFRPHQELIILLGNRGKLSDAVAHFAQYQLINPNLRFYFLFLNQFSKALHIDDAMKKHRILFHIPRYYTISPIYYFLALLYELAEGANVKNFSFSMVSPGDIEKLYDLFDFLTMNTIKEALSKCNFDVADELRKGNELLFFGIPVKLEDNGQTIALDYNRISPEVPRCILMR